MYTIYYVVMMNAVRFLVSCSSEFVSLIYFELIDHREGDGQRVLINCFVVCITREKKCSEVKKKKEEKKKTGGLI